MSNNEVHTSTKRIYGNGESLGLKSSPGTGAFDDAGKKSTEAIEHDIVTELRKAEDPNLPVFEPFLDVCPVKLLRLFGFAFASADGLQSGFFMFSEPTRGGGAGWEEEVGDDAAKDRG